MHELCPATECRTIHGQQVVGIGHEIQPGFDLPGFLGILLAGQFDAGLNLAKRNGGQPA